MYCGRGRNRVLTDLKKLLKEVLECHACNTRVDLQLYPCGHLYCSSCVLKSEDDNVKYVTCRTSCKIFQYSDDMKNTNAVKTVHNFKDQIETGTLSDFLCEELVRVFGHTKNGSMKYNSAATKDLTSLKILNRSNNPLQSKTILKTRGKNRNSEDGCFAHDGIHLKGFNASDDGNEKISLIDNYIKKNIFSESKIPETEAASNIEESGSNLNSKDESENVAGPSKPLETEKTLDDFDLSGIHEKIKNDGPNIKRKRKPKLKINNTLNEHDNLSSKKPNVEKNHSEIVDQIECLEGSDLLKRGNISHSESEIIAQKNKIRKTSIKMKSSSIGSLETSETIDKKEELNRLKRNSTRKQNNEKEIALNNNACFSSDLVQKNSNLTNIIETSSLNDEIDKSTDFSNLKKESNSNILSEDKRFAVVDEEARKSKRKRKNKNQIFEPSTIEEVDDKFLCNFVKQKRIECENKFEDNRKLSGRKEQEEKTNLVEINSNSVEENLNNAGDKSERRKRYVDNLEFENSNGFTADTVSDSNEKMEQVSKKHPTDKMDDKLPTKERKYFKKLSTSCSKVPNENTLSDLRKNFNLSGIGLLNVQKSRVSKVSLKSMSASDTKNVNIEFNTESIPNEDLRLDLNKSTSVSNQSTPNESRLLEKKSSLEFLNCDDLQSDRFPRKLCSVQTVASQTSPSLLNTLLYEKFLQLFPTPDHFFPNSCPDIDATQNQNNIYQTPVNNNSNLKTPTASGNATVISDTTTTEKKNFNESDFLNHSSFGDKNLVEFSKNMLDHFNLLPDKSKNFDKSRSHDDRIKMFKSLISDLENNESRICEDVGSDIYQTPVNNNSNLKTPVASGNATVISDITTTEKKNFNESDFLNHSTFGDKNLVEFSKNMLDHFNLLPDKSKNFDKSRSHDDRIKIFKSLISDLENNESRICEDVGSDEDDGDITIVEPSFVMDIDQSLGGDIVEADKKSLKKKLSTQVDIKKSTIENLTHVQFTYNTMSMFCEDNNDELDENTEIVCNTPIKRFNKDEDVEMEFSEDLVASTPTEHPQMIISDGTLKKLKDQTSTKLVTSAEGNSTDENLIILEQTNQKLDILDYDETPKRNTKNSRLAVSTSKTRAISSVSSSASRVCSAAKMFKRYSFVTSGLAVSEIEAVVKLADQMHAHFSRKLTNDTTHLIVKVDEKNKVLRTFKYLQALSKRLVIVSIKWVDACLKRIRFINEDTYLPLDFSGECGPYRASLAQRGLGNSLSWLKNYCICFANPIPESCPLPDLKELGKDMGAQVIDNPEEFNKYPQQHHIIIVDDEADADSLPDEQITDWLRDFKAITIQFSWLLETIGRYRLFPFVNYEVIPVAYEEMMKLNFPVTMLKEDEALENH